MTEEELQEIEDTLNGKALLNDDELLHWIKADARKLLAEVHRLRDQYHSKRMRVVKCEHEGGTAIKNGVFCCNKMKKAWDDKFVGFGSFDDMLNINGSANIYHCTPYSEVAVFDEMTIRFCPFCRSGILIVEEVDWPQVDENGVDILTESRDKEVETGDVSTEIKRLKREIEILRLFGNKDCTGMADDYLESELRGNESTRSGNHQRANQDSSDDTGESGISVELRNEAARILAEQLNTPGGYGPANMEIERFVDCVIRATILESARFQGRSRQEDS